MRAANQVRGGDSNAGTEVTIWKPRHVAKSSKRMTQSHRACPAYTRAAVVQSWRACCRTLCVPSKLEASPRIATRAWMTGDPPTLRPSPANTSKPHGCHSLHPSPRFLTPTILFCNRFPGFISSHVFSNAFLVVTVASHTTGSCRRLMM
jgi:hypothetical protein